MQRIEGAQAYVLILTSSRFDLRIRLHKASGESKNAKGKPPAPLMGILLGFNLERFGSKEVQISPLNELNRSQNRF